MSAAKYADLIVSFRHIGDYHREAGNVSTATDYHDAILAIRELCGTVERLTVERDSARREADTMRLARDSVLQRGDNYKRRLSTVTAERNSARKRTRCAERTLATIGDVHERVVAERDAALKRVADAERQLERVADVLDAWHATRPALDASE